MKHWLILYIAIAFEVCGTMNLKLAEGFSRLLPSCVVLVCYAVSFWLMSKAVEHIDMGVAYAIWSAIGIVSIALLSMIFYGESISVNKAIAYGIIISGVVMLNLTAASSGQ